MNTTTPHSSPRFWSRSPLRTDPVLAKEEAAPHAPAQPQQASPLIGGARQVVLDEATAREGDRDSNGSESFTTVEFPEDMLGTLTCGDCTDAHAGDNDALFRIEPVAQGRIGLRVLDNGVAAGIAFVVYVDASAAVQ